jgi:hypothetical protein
MPTFDQDRYAKLTSDGQIPQAITISSFYGPGTWAAWLIIMLTSWIPLQDDNAYNIHFVSYALYTNWAAMDAFRQFVVPADELWLAKHFRENISYETVVDHAAAIHAVLILGLLHALAQLWIMTGKILRVNHGSVPEDVLENRYRRFALIGIGVIFPSLAMHFSCMKVAESHSQTLLKLYVLMFWTIFVVYVMTAGVMSWEPFYRAFPAKRAILGAALFAVLITLSPVFLYVTSSLTDLREWKMRSICYVRPCTAVAISEFDQMFALFGGLVLFISEYGPRMLGIARDILQRLKARRGRSSSLPGT